MSYLYATISEYEFVKLFRECGREGDFSRAARRAMFEYLSELAADTKEPIELDVIAICCDWAEYSSAREAVAQYGDDDDSDDDDDDDEEKAEAKAIEWLTYRTQVIEFDGGIIIQSF